MTRYMLDTNIISDLLKNPQGKAAQRIAKVGEDHLHQLYCRGGAALWLRKERFKALA